MDSTTKDCPGKVPQAVLVFWIIKIAATTLGETGGDAVTMSMGLGYAVGTAIFALVFAVLVAVQVGASRYRPLLFWGVIIATTTLGTALADLMTRSLGIGYTGGSAILLTLLLTTLGLWRWATGSISLSSITSRKAEIFYWATILFSQTLGTALGDWTADDEGGLALGYGWAACIFGAALAIVAVIYFRTKISRAVLFWAAFVLTRPLGATLGDLLDKPLADGGLALSRYTASGVLVAAILLCIFLLPLRAERLRPVPIPGQAEPSSSELGVQSAGGLLVATRSLDAEATQGIP
jgi:uncharacterized membrane-anchored protein